MNLRLLIDRLNRAVASPSSDQPRTNGMPPWLARQTQRLHWISSPSYLAARELLEYSGYEADLTDARLRDDYLEALFTVARVLRAHGEETALKRAFSLDDGHVFAGRDSSVREAAANWLASIYEKRQAHHTAVWWFRQSLALARTVGVRENILSNLRGLARNLNTLGNYAEAGPCYDEILRFLNDVPEENRVSEGLAHAAMYQLEHGDQERGEAIMRDLAASAFGSSRPIEFGSTPIPFWFAAALHAFGLHYIRTSRVAEAKKLAREVLDHADRFERPSYTRPMHGLMARAFLHEGNLDGAMTALAQVHNVNATEFVSYGGNVDPGTLDLWLDIARIHAARRRYDAAMTAYQTLTYNLGFMMVGPEQGATTRRRFYWLRHMSFVVQEMVSVWLTIADGDVRKRLERLVANTLLQMKANLSIATEKSRNVKSPSLSANLFSANRRYAAAARRLAAQPDDPEILVKLEEALHLRENVEATTFDGVPENQIPSSLLMYDFWGHDTTDAFVDYSRICFQPPLDGLPGTPQGHRYIGIRIATGDCRIVDLGDAQEIDDLCASMIQACSASPRDRTPGHDPVSLDDVAGSLYGRLVAPLGPLGDAVLISTDGAVAALPFHALVRNDRWLAEDTQVGYCHSLLALESLALRQLSPGTRVLPSARRVALLMGDPSYEVGGLASLPATEIEVREVGELLKAAVFERKGSSEGERVFSQVSVHTAEDATASRLLFDFDNLPRVIHIAAHGEFQATPAAPIGGEALRFGDYYRRMDDIGASPLHEFDDRLLRSVLMLSGESTIHDDPAGGAILTALELASLTLLGCHLVVLSACETGVGMTAYGAGVLGFQYAVRSTNARAALVSLWKVLDGETAAFMVDFYQEFLSRLSEDRPVRPAYTTTLRGRCRENGRRVHPYYWAAFILLDGEYFNPMPW